MMLNSQCPKVQLAIAPLLAGESSIYYPPQSRDVALVGAPSQCQAFGAIGSHPPSKTKEDDATALMYQVTQLLLQRHSVLLSDLGALLPADMRQAAKEMGGLRKWMQTYSGLFLFSGVQGMERVSLCFLAGGGLQSSQVQSASAANQQANQQPPRSKKKGGERMTVVQLRGLPYRATLANIKAFIGAHADSLEDGDQSIQLQYGRDGRFSGFVYIQFNSPDAASLARTELHMRQISLGDGSQSRYVETFLLSETKGRSVLETGSSRVQRDSDPTEIESSTVAFDGIANECREHMASPGRQVLLLSMLGSALSTSSRKFMKETGHGFMHVLAQYPGEFKIEGTKGKEVVTHLPAGVPVLQGLAGECGDLMAELARPSGDLMAELARPSTPSIPGPLPCSPRPCFETPSDWGTPKPVPMASTFMHGGQPMMTGDGARPATLHMLPAYPGMHAFNSTPSSGDWVNSSQTLLPFSFEAPSLSDCVLAFGGDHLGAAFRQTAIV